MGHGRLFPFRCVVLGFSRWGNLAPPLSCHACFFFFPSRVLGAATVVVVSLWCLYLDRRH